MISIDEIETLVAVAELGSLTPPAGDCTERNPR
jgi:hypothetical protein